MLRNMYRVMFDYKVHLIMMQLCSANLRTFYRYYVSNNGLDYIRYSRLLSGCRIVNLNYKETL